MVTYFNKKDMVSFGKYLLSEERKQSIQRNNGSEVWEQVLREVHHADVANWMEGQKK